MSPETEPKRIRIVCTECHFSEVVEKDGDKPASVIVEHGRETGHKLRTEAAAAPDGDAPDGDAPARDALAED